MSGYPPPEIPDPLPDAPATAGEQYTSYSIGEGTYRVFAASIHSSNAYEEECRISVVNTDATGGEIETCLDSGVVSQNRPFALKDERLISGPGYIRGYIYNLDATGFSFRVSLSKIRRGGTIS